MRTELLKNRAFWLVLGFVVTLLFLPGVTRRLEDLYADRCVIDSFKAGWPLAHVSSDYSVLNHYTANLEQLDVPLGPCHIEIKDLPDSCIQNKTNDFERLWYRLDLAGKEPASRFDWLKYTRVQQAWIDDTGKTLGFILLSDVGSSVIWSTNGGATWIGPYYLGMHRLPDREYHILGQSLLPLLSHDRIQVEVTIWKIDPSRPYTSKLAGASYTQKIWDKYLSVPISVLVQDSDGDGLTDLLEERILTDPGSGDTDGDGIGDACDNQPLTSFQHGLTDVDSTYLAILPRMPGLLGAIFDYQRESDDLQNVGGLLLLSPTAVKYYTTPKRTPLKISNTIFVQSGFDVFAGITGVARFIVLNEDAVLRYRKKFRENAMFPECRFEKIKFSHGFRRANVMFKSWQNIDEIELEKKYGIWQMKQHSTCHVD